MERAEGGGQGEEDQWCQIQPISGLVGKEALSSADSALSDVSREEEEEAAAAAAASRAVFLARIPTVDGYYEAAKKEKDAQVIDAAATESFVARLASFLV